MNRAESEKLKNEWAELYNSGKSLNEIAKMYNCNKITVKGRITGLVEFRDKFSNDMYAEDWGKLYLNGYSITDISEISGKSKSIVMRVLKKFGYHSTDGSLRKYDHLKEKMFDMYVNGMSFREIGEELGISKHTVCNYVKLVNPSVVRTYEETSRKHKINKKFFDSFNENNTFLLGLMVGNTSVVETPRNRNIRLDYPGKKEWIVSFIFNSLGYEKTFINYSEKEDFIKAEIACLYLLNRLKEIGIRELRGEQKYLEIPVEFKNNFMEGYIYNNYYDGEGYTSIYEQGSYTKEYIRDWLSDYLGLDKEKIKIGPKGKNLIIYTKSVRNQLNKTIQDIERKYKI